MPEMPTVEATAEPTLFGKPVEGPSEEQKKLWKQFTAEIDQCKEYKKKLIPGWSVSIDYRRGKPLASQSDEDRVVVNIDWPMTKAKEAALFSQIPQVRINHPPQSFGASTATFEQRVNDTLITSGIETAMDEVLPDVINAAGIGAVIVARETLTEQVEVPLIDFATMPPELAQQIQQSGTMPDGQPIPTKKIDRVVDSRYTTTRISPADLLWKLKFTGADFDKSPWTGRSGEMPWALGKSVFKLKDEEKQKLCAGQEERGVNERLTHETDKDKQSPEEMIRFDELFYWEHLINPEVKSFSAIHHLVFVAGKDEPVIDEPWKGQQFGQDGKLIGSMKYPIRVLTLTYVSDDTIPPSDSAIGRSQVNELNKSRTQQMQQRDRSLPMRWIDINRVDPAILQSIMRGTYQSVIPVQGAGDKIIGETSRASYPPENNGFDAMMKQDISDIWNMGPNQQGNFGQGRQSATEANVVQSNYSTRIGRERAKVAKFFVSIAEVLAGLLVLYEDPKEFGEDFDPAISRALQYSILADSTVLLDNETRMKRIENFVNFSAKSGFVDIETVLKEYATLSGVNPQAIKKPEPAPPAEPNISVRMSGAEDLMQPLPLAFMIKSGQAPTPEQVAQAKQMIQLSMMAPALGPGIPDPNAPPQMGPDGQPLPPGAGPTQPPLPGMPPQGPPPTMEAPAPMPEPPPPPVGGAHPQWALLDRINKRTEEGQ